MSLIDSLKKDIHYIESLNSCMNCGVCTAICPSAEFYNYDPRIIADTVQRQDEESIEGLLKSDTIWYCGECMSCKTRCPRCNTPGGIIMALRRLSQEKGWFTESEKGRQQFALKRILGNNILNYGYCVTPDIVKPEMHPEQGPVWEWIYEHRDEVFELQTNGSRRLKKSRRRLAQRTETNLRSNRRIGIHGEYRNLFPPKSRGRRDGPGKLFSAYLYG